MIEQAINIKYGGQKYDSYIILDKNENIIVPPSIYLTYLVLRGRSPITNYNYACTLDRYFNFLSQNKIVWHNVLKSNFSEYFEECYLSKENVKSETLELYKTVIEEFYKWAWNNDLLSSPVEVFLPTSKYSRSIRSAKDNKCVEKALVSQYISKEKLVELLSYIKTNNSFLLERNELIICLGYYMGCRVSEITDPRNFTIEEIEELKTSDKKTKYLSIIGKGSKAREVVVLKDIHDKIINFYNSKLIPKNAQSIICKKNGGPLSAQTASKIFKDAKKSTLDPYWDTRVFHSLRHSFATNMVTYLYNNGQQNFHFSLSDMMGHVSKKTTNIYVSFEDSLNQRHSVHGNLNIKPNNYIKSFNQHADKEVF